MIYLASPYSHSEPTVREERFQAVCQTAALLIKSGITVFSPIAHSHPINAFGVRGDWEFWESFDRKLIESSDMLVVLMLNGWNESVGVLAEISLAIELRKPVRLLHPDLVVSRDRVNELLR